MKRLWRGSLMAASACGLMTLASCASSKVALRPDLPQMPAALQQPCKHPLISEVDARAIIARYAVALNKCDGKRADAVAFHDSLRKGLK
jgi:hypothetical protein